MLFIEGCANIANIDNEIVNGISKKIAEDFSDFRLESSQDDFVSHLLWSSRAEPHFKPYSLSTTSSKLNSKKMDAIDLQTPSKINTSNKLHIHNSSTAVSRSTNFSRLYSHLKTNVAKESQSTISHRSQRSAHTTKSLPFHVNARRNRLSGGIPTIKFKAKKNQNHVTHAVIPDAPKQLDQRITNKLHKGGDKIKPSKPKLMVSHIPHEILPKTR